jgi:hypothetical protein
VVRPFETSSVNISGSCEAHLRSALRFGDRSYVRVVALQSRFERLTKLKPPALPGDTYFGSRRRNRETEEEHECAAVGFPHCCFDQIPLASIKQVLEVDDQLEPDRLLHRQVGGL